MLRKNALVIAIMVMFVVAMSACSKKQTVEPTPPVEPPPVTEPEPPAEPEPVVEEVEPEKIPVLGDVFFDFDKYTLTDAARTQLQENARQLKDAPSASIIIEGHCDERGTNAYNLALGEKRAMSAKDYLVSLGVPGSRINTVSYGEERPFDPGHSEAAWAKNRRGHFVLAK